MLLAYPRVVAAGGRHTVRLRAEKPLFTGCLLYTSDAADE